jgi:glycosyltransferase involved in cell wall biosynthesis
VHTHLFDPSLIGLTVAKRQGRRTVLTRHHSDAIHEIASPLKKRFYLGLENYISRKADHIIAPSRMVWEYLVEREGVPAQKVSIIPYGQTTERFDAVTPEKVAAVRDELGMDGTLSMVCVSRLFHRKGHKYLFEAYAALKKQGRAAKIYLVGDGDHRAELETAAAALGIAEDVRFLGWRGDALTIMAAADLIVHPSLEDALSSAVIESIMLEKPIVATDISGARDSLGDGRYGKIVPPADAEAFRAGILDILADPDTARQHAREGRKFLLDYMDAARVAAAYTDIYKRVSTEQ